MRPPSRLPAYPHLRCARPGRSAGGLVGAARGEGRSQWGAAYRLGAAASSDDPPQRQVDGRLARPPRSPSGNLLGRLAAGISLTLGGKTNPTPLDGPIANANSRPDNGWVMYQVKDANGAVLAANTVNLSSGTSDEWQPLQTGVRVPAGAAIVEVSVGAATSANSYVLFDDLTVEQTGGLIVQEQHQYAYGAPLPGLSYTVGNLRYRYGYQGQYAEKDAETGYESFELRLYNSRIGRWMSNDPEGQHFSPYLGMGNNPVRMTDPDGGQDLPEVAITAASQGSKFLAPRIAQLIVPAISTSLPRILTPIFRSQSLIPSGGFTSAKERDYTLKLLYNEQNAWYQKNARYPGDAFYHEPGLETVYPEQYIIPIFQGLRAISLAKAATKVALAEAVTEEIPQVTANRIAGNLYRDEVADALRQAGKQVETEVYKKTPFGKRFIDIEVSENGTVQGGIETKVGGSRYTSAQRAKDMYLERVQGYKVYVLRKPKIW